MFPRSPTIDGIKRALCKGIYQAKKLATISTTFILVTASLEAISLQYIPYISYLVQFQGKEIRALINSGNKINAIALAYTSKLGFRVHRINIGAQKIDNSILENFSMVLVDFQVENKLGRARFFEEIFLLTNISTEILLGMFFLILNNADI